MPRTLNLSTLRNEAVMTAQALAGLDALTQQTQPTTKAMTTPSTIPTPETDAALTGATWIKASHSTKEYVPAELARSLERRLSIALAALDKLNDMLELGPVLWQASNRHEHAKKLIEDTLDEITSLAKQP